MRHQGDRAREPSQRAPEPARFLLYSHDGFGLGHFRRNLVLAEALIDSSPTASVLLACAADGLDTFTLPDGVDVVRLPGLRKMENGRYVGRRLHLDTGRVRALRASLLASAVEGFRPHVLLADKHPLGIDGELLPAIRAQRSAGRRTALGLRDVLDDARTTREDWAGYADLVERLYELVLVYGSRELLVPLRPDLIGEATAARMRYCGYVVSEIPKGDAPADLPGHGGRKRVLATVGGGEDGMAVLHAFAEASRGAEWLGLVVAGPQMAPNDWYRVRAAAHRAGVIALRTVSSIQRWYRHVDAVVCMGGYNTLVEVMASATPTVCVPRTRPRTEQLIRARAFAAAGMIELVEPTSLDPGILGAAIGRVLRTPREVVRARARASLDLGGAARAAAHLLELAAPGVEADPGALVRAGT